MFTGIVEERGAIASITKAADAARVEITAATVLQDARLGDSIAVNGVCLTIADFTEDGFVADVMDETLRRTSLGSARPGSSVNLERAARLDSLLGGHLVQGHVDGTGVVHEIIPGQHWTLMRIGVPDALHRYLAEKGSVAVDGVSLTVVSVDEEPQPTFAVSLIPTTLAKTTLGERAVGDIVNLEVDVIAKYVERLLGGRR